MDKKRIIIIVSVVVAIIVVLVVVMMFWKKGSPAYSEGKLDGKADEMGIHYGGSFNEFQYQEETESLEEEATEVDLDEAAAEIKKIEEEFKKNLPGDILSEGDEDIDNGNRISERAVINSDKSREEKEADNIGAAGDRAVAGSDVPIEEAEGDEEITPHIIKSSGYAEHEVLCDAESQEAAESIAAQIGGTVLSCQNGVATIQIEEHVDTLLERLEQQGSSLELYRNYYVSAP